MLYFSEVFGKQVYNQQGRYLGKLHDLLFLPVETPLITKAVIQDRHKQELIIPSHLLKKNNNSGFILTGPFEPQEKKETEASILKNVQDKQILDLKGEKIIRANDVAIKDTAGLVVEGIDIGMFGVFRWIGIAKIVAGIVRSTGIHVKSEFLPWDQIQPLEATRGKIIVKQEKDKIKKVPPENLADYLERTTTVNALKILKFMDPELSAHVIGDINVGFQAELLRNFSHHKAAEILSLMDADEAVDVLLTFSQKRRDEILKHILREKKQAIVHLLKHAVTPIGHVMSNQYLSVPADDTIKMVAQRVKQTVALFSDLPYIYATNTEGQIVGVISLYDLFKHPPDMPVYKCMLTNVVLIRLTTPKEIAIQKMLKYSLQAVPVVDENRNILGIVLFDDVAKDVFEKFLGVRV